MHPEKCPQPTEGTQKGGKKKTGTHLSPGLGTHPAGVGPFAPPVVPRGGGNPGGSGDFSQEPRFHGTQQGGVTHGPAASWGPSVRAAPEPPPATSTVGTCSLWDPSGGTAATQMSPDVPRCPQVQAGHCSPRSIWGGTCVALSPCASPPRGVPSPRCPLAPTLLGLSTTEVRGRQRRVPV